MENIDNKIEHRNNNKSTHNREEITKVLVNNNLAYLQMAKDSVLDIAKKINKVVRGKYEMQPKNFIINKLFSTNEIKPGEVVEFGNELEVYNEDEILLSEIADIGYYLIQLSHYNKSAIEDFYNFLEVLNITPKDAVGLIETKYQYRLENGKNKEEENELIKKYWEADESRKLDFDKDKVKDFIKRFVKERGEVLRNRELPIWNIMPEVIEKLNNENVLIIKSETGSGKTTQIPQGLFESGFCKDDKKIITTENRVVIARETGNRVAQEIGCSSGELVGYITGRDKKVSDKTKIIYETCGVLKNVLKRNPNLDGVSVVMIDEFDERTLDQDLTIALIRKAQKNGSKVKLILTSATGDFDKLQKHFDCDHVEAKGRPFPVETVWSEEEIKSYELNSFIADKVQVLNSQYERNESILIFLPGKAEINQAIKAVEKLNITDVTLLPFHGELDKSSLHKVFEPSSGRKIVFATDMAQRGLTLGKLHVIDACLQKRVEYDPEKDCQALVLRNISKSDSRQRKGRAGRVSEGTYHPAITERQFDNLNKETPPEILRMPLRSVVLQIKAMGYSREGDRLKFITDPGKSNWKEAKNQLRLLGLLDNNNEENLSEKGKLAAKLPCDPRDAVSLIEAIKLGCEKDMAIIIAMKMSRNLLIRPRNENDRNVANQIHKNLQLSDQSDMIGLLNVYKETEKNIRKNGWCRENFVSYRGYQDIKNNIRTINDILRRINGKIKPQKNQYSNEEKLLLSIYEGNKDKVFNKSGWAYSKTEGNDYDDYILARESVADGQIVIANEIIEVPTRKGGRIKLIAKASKIPESLMEKRSRNMRWSNEEKCVVEEQYMVFKNIELDEKSKDVISDINKNSIKCFCEALLHNRIDTEISNEIYGHNNKVKQEVSKWRTRAGGEIENIENEYMINIFQSLLSPYKIISLQAFEELFANQKLSIDDFKLNLDDFVSLEERIKIEKDNPETISIDGQDFSVEYESGYSSFTSNIEVDEEFVRNTQQDKVVLPGGREVKITCNNYSANAFSELLEKLEKKRVDDAWNKSRKENEHTSWISNTEDVYQYLSKILTSVEITTDSNGEMIFGYFSLYSDSDPDFKIKLKETLQEAEEETKIGLKRLYQKSTKQTLRIPDEMPWKDGRSLTEIGEVLKKAISLQSEKAIEDLSLNNILQKIESVSEEFEKLKDDIGEKYITNKKILSETENSLNIMLREVDNEFYENDIRNINIEFQNAKEALNEANYEKVVTVCNKIKNDLDFLKEKDSNMKTQIENGEIMINFKHFHRRGGITNNSDAWVIKPDGSFRERDEDTVRRYKSDGDYIWKEVYPEELALSWSCGTSRDIYTSSDFTVEKMPVDNLTEEQLQAIKTVTEDIGVESGVFGFDTEFETKKENFIEKVNILFPNANLKPEQYFALRGDNGVSINGNYNIDWNKPFDQSCESRDAQIVESEEFKDGVLEILAYDKWGSYNFNLRFRMLSEEERAKLKEDEEGMGDFGELLEQAWHKKKKTKNVEMGSIVSEQEKGGSAFEPEPANSDKTHYVETQNPVSKEEKTEEKKELPILKLLTEMDEDEIMEEYEENEKKIERINKEHPHIAYYFKKYNKHEKLERLKTQYGMADGKRRAKLKGRIDKLKADSDLQNYNNGEMRQTIKRLDFEKKRLDQLRARQVEIEKYLE